MRQRSQTIGTLGRSPARQPAPAPAVPPPNGDNNKGSGDGRGLVGQWLHGAVFDNVGLKFLSLVLAVTVFLLINTDNKEHDITVSVPVEYDMPANKQLTSKRVEAVSVTIKGPLRRLKQFDHRELSRIVLPLRDAPTGNIQLTPDMINGRLPLGLTVTAFNPPVAHVTFDKSIEKLVEIEPVVGGFPKHGYVKQEVRATPATIKVRGGESALQTLSTIKTSEIDITDKFELYEGLANPAPPEGVVVVDKTQRITVQVRIGQALVMRTASDITITPRGDNVDPAKWKISPSNVDVELTGPQLLVEKFEDKVKAFVKIERAAGDKPRELEVTTEGIPPSLGLGIKVSPARVMVAPVAAIKPAPPPP